MIEVNADIWTYPADYRCITTNGIVKKNGELVMGAGIALEAAKRFPELPARLGKNVSIFGNIPYIFHEWKIISFPTKNHWKDPSSLELIEKSAKEILTFANILGIISISLTRPGCGLGKLDWADVKPVLDKYFDDRFIVCTK